MIENKKILIIGGTGSLGKTLISRLKDKNILGIYSRDEAKHWTIKNEIKSKNVEFFVGDIRDYDRIESIIKSFDPHIVIIAAALKQVDTCELSPEESIKTNIQGPKNVAKVIDLNNHRLQCECVLMVSTDKACEPVNVYGMCKSIAERVVANKALTHKNVRFVGTRYGNVLDSRGSIIPLFKYQAKNNSEITITDDRMTRFVMTIDESVDLILFAINNAKSGEIIIPKLKAMNILDLAKIYSKLSNKPVKKIGIRPGEKINEKLICEAESLRVEDIGSHYILKPAFEMINNNQNIFEYTSSDDVLSIEELENYLKELNHLDLDIKNYTGKRIEEINTKHEREYCDK